MVWGSILTLLITPLMCLLCHSLCTCKCLTSNLVSRLLGICGRICMCVLVKFVTVLHFVCGTVLTINASNYFGNLLFANYYTAVILWRDCYKFHYGILQYTVTPPNGHRILFPVWSVCIPNSDPPPVKISQIQPWTCEMRMDRSQRCLMPSCYMRGGHYHSRLEDYCGRQDEQTDGRTDGRRGTC